MRPSVDTDNILSVSPVESEEGDDYVVVLYPNKDPKTQTSSECDGISVEEVDVEEKCVTEHDFDIQANGDDDDTCENSDDDDTCDEAVNVLVENTCKAFVVFTIFVVGIVMIIIKTH